MKCPFGRPNEMYTALYFFIFVQGDKIEKMTNFFEIFFSTGTFLSYFWKNRQDLVALDRAIRHILWHKGGKKVFARVFNSLWKSPVENQMERKKFLFLLQFVKSDEIQFFGKNF